MERMARGVAIRRQIRVCGQAVPMYVSPDAQLKYLKPGRNAFDSDLIRIAEQYVRHDSVVWDIGANVGIFGFAAAAIAVKGTVVAVEPDVWLASLLRRSASLPENRQRDIRVVPMAVSASNSVATLLIAQRGRANNALEEAGGRSQMGGIREKQYIPTLTLDCMLNALPEPSFVKVDIEGAELLALQGATRLVQSVRPAFYIEVGDDVSVEVFNLLARAGYRAMDTEGQRLHGHCRHNTLFIPE